MKQLRSILTGLCILLMIALLAAPLGFALLLPGEDALAGQGETPVAIGAFRADKVSRAILQNVQEYVKVTGVLTSDAYAYQELDYKKPGDIRWTVNVGEEVQAGQVLGTYQGESVLAAENGILVEVNTYSTKPYLRYRLFAPLELSCRVSQGALAQLQDAPSLTTEIGHTAVLSYVSSRRNEDGTTNIRLRINNPFYIYGQTIKDLKLLTGKVYELQMVLPVSCVYQKSSEEDAPWYVRQVTMQGELIGEREVEIGYRNDEIVCVVGVESNTFYDGSNHVVG